MQSLIFKRSVLIRFLQILVLVFILTISTPHLVKTQTQPPQSREELLLRVREAAELDVDIDRAANPDEMLELYDGNRLGVSREEILRTYKESYQSKKELDAQDFFGIIRPESGWFVALLVFIYALAQDKLKEVVKAGISRIEQAVYQNFSGTQLFRAKALRRYKGALLHKHQTLKIPFRSSPLDMREIYVPLKVSGRQDGGETDAVNAIKQYRRLMVKGQPGSGKTVLLRYLALQYADENLELSDKPVVILLELHRLRDGEDILQHLIKALERDDFPNGEHFLKQILEKGQAFLLLDGLDELNESERRKIVLDIKNFLDIYSRCRTVVTCRTLVYFGEFDALVDQTLEISEFSDSQIQQCLRPWKKSMPRQKSVEQLVQALNSRPQIKELSRNPLLLTMIAYLYTDTPFTLPHSRAEFYSKSTELLLETWDQVRQTPNYYKGFTKKLVLQHLALFAQDSSSKRGEDRKSLGFDEVLAETRLVLPRLNLDPEADLEPILREIVERSGLLLKIDGGARYQFSHLTLQEFFSASALLERGQELLDRFMADNSSWREAVKLWCGIANDSTKLLKKIYSSQPLIGFECLADVQKVDSSLAERIVEDLKAKMDVVDPPDSISSSLAAIASDTRPRGREVFVFLTEKVKAGPLNKQKEIAVHALSLTNCPEAASVLAGFYSEDVIFRSALTRMGDVAIPYLSRLIERGETNAIEGFIKIQTLESAKKLVYFLSSDELFVSSKSAYYLASMLRHEEIESYLHQCNFDVSRYPKTSWDWVWGPFNSPEQSCVPQISARIMSLIAENMAEYSSLSDISLDKRFLYPLLLFNKDFIDALPDTLPYWFSHIDPDALTTFDKKGKEQFLDDLLDVDHISPDILPFWESLSLDSKTRLLLRILKTSKPQPYHWIEMYRESKFLFIYSWHYRILFLLALSLSLISIFHGLKTLIDSNFEWKAWIITSPIAVLIHAWFFWGFGIDDASSNKMKERFNPSLLMQFGILGCLNFSRQFKLLLYRGTTWHGFEEISWILERLDFTWKLVISSCLSLCFLIIVLLVKLFSIQSVLCFLSAVFLSTFVAALTAMTNAIARVESGGDFISNEAFMTALGGTLVSIFFLIPALSAFCNQPIWNAALGAAIGLSLVSYIIYVSREDGWYRGGGISTGKKRLYIALLAFPYFCSAPVCICYSTLAFAQFFSFTAIICIWISILALGAVLWRRGHYLERVANNPLKNLLQRNA